MKMISYVMIAGLWLTAMVSASAAPVQLTVQVENGQLREKASVFGKIVADVKYGDRVDVLVTQGPWVQVRTADGRAGWMHESSLTRKKLALSSGASDVNRTASGEELAMAGKGFNSQVEADFKSKNATVDFTWIDRMEKYKVSERESLAFLKEGGLQ